MTRTQSSSLRELAQHYVDPNLPGTLNTEELCRLLSKHHHAYVGLKGDTLVLAVHPTPGQKGIAMKFPVTHAKLEENIQNLLREAEVVTPQMGIGFTALPTGQQAILMRTNYAAMVQLRDQLTAAIEHSDFDFEPYQYRRVDGGISGLVIDLIPDASLPALPELPKPKKSRKKADA